MTGGKVSESERSIHIGNLGSISAAQFPANFDYIALGHLHHPQKVGDLSHVRYSGSPIPLSFSEVGTNKELRLLEIEGRHFTQQPIEIPVFRPLYRLKGTASMLREEIENLTLNEKQLTPWLEVAVSETEFSSTLNDELRELAAQNGLEVLKVEMIRSKSIRETADFEEVQIDELIPEQVFQKRLESYEGDVDKDTMSQCFAHVLNRLNEEVEA